VQIFSTLRLIGSFHGLLVVFIGGGLLSFAVFVYTGFIQNVPRALEEAATLDGASQFHMFWRIIFPLPRPATATVAIFLSLWMWAWHGCLASMPVNHYWVTNFATSQLGPSYL